MASIPTLVVLSQEASYVDYVGRACLVKGARVLCNASNTLWPAKRGYHLASKAPSALHIRQTCTLFELRALAEAFATFLVRFQKIVFFQNFGGTFLPSQGTVPVGTEKSIHGRPSGYLLL